MVHCSHRRVVLRLNGPTLTGRPRPTDSHLTTTLDAGPVQCGAELHSSGGRASSPVPKPVDQHVDAAGLPSGVGTAIDALPSDVALPDRFILHHEQRPHLDFRLGHTNGRPRLLTARRRLDNRRRLTGFKRR